MIKVSVVVPIYNAEQYLSRCLESLVNQTLSDIEIILVDDGSTDSSSLICDAFKEKHANIKAVHKANGGVAKARNDGLKLATGEYVIFVDSDDEVPCDAYQNMYEEAIRSNADIVVGDVYQVIGTDKKYCHFYKDRFVSSDADFKIQLIKADFYRNYCPCPYNGKVAFGYGGPWNKLVKMELITQNGIEFDPSVKGIFDDIIYTAYILDAAGTISYISNPVYTYYINEESITHGYKENILEINNAIFDSWMSFLKKSGKNEELLPAFYANVLRRFADSVERYFYYQIAMLKNKGAYREMRDVMHCYPYKNISEKVEYKKLSAYHKTLFWALKVNSPRLVYIFFTARRLAKSLL